MYLSNEVEEAVAEFVSVEGAAVEFDSEVDYQDKVMLLSVTYQKHLNVGNEMDHPMDSGRRVTKGQQCYSTRHCAHSQSQRPSIVFRQIT